MSAAKSAVKSAATEPDRHWYFRDAPQLPEKWRSPLAQDQLLYEYLVHNGHFAHFAISRGLTVDQFYDWLHSEPVVERRRRLGELADERAELVARLNRPAALAHLARTIENENAHPRERRLAASAILRAANATNRRGAERAKVTTEAAHSPHHPITSSPPSPSQSQSPSHRITVSPSHSPSHPLTPSPSQPSSPTLRLTPSSSLRPSPSNPLTPSHPHSPRPSPSHRITASPSHSPPPRRGRPRTTTP